MRRCLDARESYTYNGDGMLVRRTSTPLPPQMLHSQDFTSQGTGWTSAWSGSGSVTWGVNPNDGTSHTTTLRLTGNATDWTVQTYRNGLVSDTQQARVAFKLSQTGSGAVVGLESSDGANYIAVYEDQGKLYLRTRLGTSFTNPVTLMSGLDAMAWYVLELGVDDAAGMRVSVWKEGVEGTRYEARYEMPRGVSWRFRAWAYKGSLFLDGPIAGGAYKEERPTGTTSDARLVGKHFEYDYALNRQTKRYYANGELLATRTTQFGCPPTGTCDTLTYVQADHLGSTSTLTNGSGAVVGRERYSAFGERRRMDNLALTDQLYTGQRLNVLSNLYHYSDGTSAGRFYDPLLGRFVMADSITPGKGSQPLNRYAYANNNPVAFIDPDGHCAFGDDGNISRFDCNTQEFEALNSEQRIQWMQTFARQFDLDGWFDNIVDIISYFAQSDVLHNLDRGSWASWSDAGVLEAIQNGRVMYEGRTPIGESGGAAAKWSTFFGSYRRSGNDVRKQLWAQAEQAGVNYGTAVADQVIGRPDGLEGAVIHDFIQAGDVY